VTFCSAVTELAVDAALGGASDFPLQAAVRAMHVTRAILRKFIDAMGGIIMEFAKGRSVQVLRVRRTRIQATPRSNAAHTAQVAAPLATVRPISSLQPIANSRNALTASSTSSTT